MSQQNNMFNIIRLLCSTSLVAMALILTPAAPARAAGLWYVDGGGGSDANPCNSPNLPCKTINAAIAKAQPGDFIYVTKGAYKNPGGMEVVRVDKNLTLVGGWDSNYSNNKLRYSVLHGEQARRGLVVAPGVTARMQNFLIARGWNFYGGGAYVEGTLDGMNMIVGLNRAWFGGGFYVAPGGRLNLVTTAIYRNEYSADGGGIFIDGGTSYILNSTISTNLSVASIDEEHCHQYAYGGGVFVQNGGYLWASHATFAENNILYDCGYTTNGAGIANFGGRVELANTLIADGCFGDILSFGHNLERTDTCHLMGPSDKPNTSPEIYPAAAYYGGNTYTHALKPNSPAIDAANSYYCPGDDQRRVPRPQGSACDIGAVERIRPDPAMGIIDPDPCPPDETGRPEQSDCYLEDIDLARWLDLPPESTSVEAQLDSHG